MLPKARNLPLRAYWKLGPEFCNLGRLVQSTDERRVSIEMFHPRQDNGFKGFGKVKENNLLGGSVSEWEQFL